MAIDYITDRRQEALYQCFLRYRPTKQGHNYLPIYDRYFSPIRQDVRKVLEIGVQSGKSLRMWRDYFPNAEIYGLDLDPACKAVEEDRIRIAIGDQSNPSDLAKLPTDFDIIIDDGSHIPAHQINTFRYLFRHNMNERGVYAVEDCVSRPTTIKWFKKLADHVNYWPRGLSTREWPKFNSFDRIWATAEREHLIRNVLGVSFYRFLVMIDKGRNPEDGTAAHRLHGRSGQTTKAASS
ncbi:class I SAM-dependent methyltransferase [Rhodospirillaceae bacterium SYSU D60014]|uniref:class I SAM-dependent methyltransferase n=1 Tax=Virgifigura deserti TaxID=2268457 RepID=UPI000E669B9D